MQLAVLADVHGNLPALKAVLQTLQGKDLSGILVAGDLTGCPWPNEAIQLLIEHNCIMIRGNGENGLLKLIDHTAPHAWEVNKQYALARWTVRTLDPSLIPIIRSLPNQRVIHMAGTDPIRMVHGSPFDSSDSIYPHREPENFVRAMEAVSEPVTIFGHTHSPWQVRLDGHLAFNPGAVSAPLDGKAGAQYAILTWSDGCWRAQLHHIPYDLKEVRRGFEQSGLLKEGGALARTFLLSIETGIDVTDDFIDLAYELMHQTTEEYTAFIPDEIWDLADKQFNWQNYKN